MEHHDLTDELDRRLRAARPSAARVDSDAFDSALLARVQQQPIAARRTVSRSVTVPIAAGVIVVATAAVVLGGGPDNVGGPASAAAITQQTLRWLDPPAGTILHVRSVETEGTQTTTRELWQSADDPNKERELIEGAQTFETSGDAIYDPATNTIYDPYESPSSAVASPADKAKQAKLGTSEKSPGGAPAKGSVTAGDPIVDKVRILLEDGRMSVTGRELHGGTDAWVISLNPDSGRQVWRLWVSVADGKPLELIDPGRNTGDPVQDVTWPVYETLTDDTATTQLLTLAGAHPSAQVVHDPAQAEAAEQRLLPPKP